MKRKNIELNIEELVLPGFKASERYRIGEAVERELARLFAEQGMPQSLVKSGEIARLEAVSLVAQGSKSELIGTWWQRRSMED